MAEERLQKFLSAAGIASRRKCEDLIVEGRVQVNGKVVTVLGTRVRPGVDHVQVDGMAVSYDPRHVYLLLYKPTRVISAVTDPEGREVVNDLIPSNFGRVYPVGRLDWDSEGALLMTNDGRLTELLTHPRYEVMKVYMVKVDGIVANDDRRIDLLRHGVRLDDGYVTQPAEVTRDADTGRHTWFVVGIREGRNRQVRRMFEAIGIDVRKLKRIAYGPVPLGDMLPGDYRRLAEDEISDLYEAAGEERDVLDASRGRLHVSRRNRADRDRADKQDSPRRVRVNPEDIGLEGVYSKSERALLQRQANEAFAGPQSADGERLSAQDVDAPRSRRPGEFRRRKPAPAPTPASTAQRPAQTKDGAPLPERPTRKSTGGRPAPVVHEPARGTRGGARTEPGGGRRGSGGPGGRSDSGRGGSGGGRGGRGGGGRGGR